MKTFSEWLSAYGVSHQNPTNKLIHWICVPTIMFSLLGLLYSIPFPVEKTMFFNWAGVFIFLTLLFYLRLSFSIFLGFIFIAGAMLWGNHQLALTGTNLPIVSVILFVVAWIGQFIGHKIEGKKPSFFEDLQFLLIGPAWLLHFIYKKVGIPY
ncbi:MAG TPA: DUF962 domain-containing protein [Chitinophagales bacterium]|jgi:uncharacterized membrane protein YGL010W|nr:DUF962 domain-containing protein [Chitinophagales bacterium]